MKHLVRAALVKLGINTPTGGHVRPRDPGDDIPVMLSPGGPQCDQARIMTPRFVARHLYIERCRLELAHQGDHQPGTPEPIDAATELTRHDQEHGHYQEDT